MVCQVWFRQTIDILNMIVNMVAIAIGGVRNALVVQMILIYFGLYKLSFDGNYCKE